MLIDKGITYFLQLIEVTQNLSPCPRIPEHNNDAECTPTEQQKDAYKPTSKPATGEGMDKSTLVHTQIQIIIIHFLEQLHPME
jgi:hypothetical protein